MVKGVDEHVELADELEGVPARNGDWVLVTAAIVSFAQVVLL